MKKGLTNERFRDVKTFQNYALCNEFMTFTDSEQTEQNDAKMVHKMIPKSIKINPNGAQDRFIH